MDKIFPDGLQLVNSSSDHSSSESLVFSSFSSTDPNLVLFLVSSFNFVDELEEILRLSFLLGLAGPVLPVATQNCLQSEDHLLYVALL